MAIEGEGGNRLIQLHGLPGLARGLGAAIGALIGSWLSKDDRD